MILSLSSLQKEFDDLHGGLCNGFVNEDELIFEIAKQAQRNLKNAAPYDHGNLYELDCVQWENIELTNKMLDTYLHFIVLQKSFIDFHNSKKVSFSNQSKKERESYQLLRELTRSYNGHKEAFSYYLESLKASIEENRGKDFSENHSRLTILFGKTVSEERNSDLGASYHLFLQSYQNALFDLIDQHLKSVRFNIGATALFNAIAPDTSDDIFSYTMSAISAGLSESETYLTVSKKIDDQLRERDSASLLIQESSISNGQARTAYRFN